MALSLYEGRKRQGNWPYALMAVNLLFAGGCMFWWSLMSLVIADAMSWATWGDIGRGVPDFFQYPFMLLWALPIGGSCLAWSFQKVYRERLAIAASLFPILLIGVIVAWYNLAPLHWR
jgi:hypothetical protein